MLQCGLCSLDPLDGALWAPGHVQRCWVLGVGVGVEIKVCFLPFHVAWSFGLDGRDAPSPEGSDLGCQGGLQIEVNPRYGLGRGSEPITPTPEAPLLRASALRGAGRKPRAL